MSQQGQLSRLIEDRRRNTILNWVLIAFIFIVVIENIISGDILWAVFTGVVLLLALIPPVSHRDVGALLPWEVLLIASLPIFGRSFAEVVFTSEIMTYLSVAALALMVSVELDVFTPVKMTHWFAVLFVIMSTMATAGVWAVVRWLSDIYLSTTFLIEPTMTQAELHAVEAQVMWEFIYSTIAGIVGGVIFEAYFRRRIRSRDRLPEPVKEVIE
ncbi:MAG: hypothetical protein ABEI06_00220 [Halobacteriaceae archaeon]